MPYQHLIIKLLRELEEDEVITNRRERTRTRLRRMIYKLRARWGKIQRLFRRR